jgi:hypothetical protein
MCGRFEIHSTLDIIARIFQISNLIFDVKPNYNIESIGSGLAS